MAKCIILSRVSTTQQELDSQTQSIKNEAYRHGFKDNNLIIIEDKESVIKLSEEERNGLNKMKEFIENDSSITHVFIYEPVADVYTNVDNNIYEIHMNSWTGDAYMMTRGLLDMAK